MNCDQCLQPADHAIRYSNTPDFHPICDPCLQQHEQDVYALNDHEIRHFNGAYGLVSFELDELEKYEQSGDREPLMQRNEI